MQYELGGDLERALAVAEGAGMHEKTYQLLWQLKKYAAAIVVGLRYTPKLMRADIAKMNDEGKQSVMSEVFVKISQSLETNEDAGFDAAKLERFLKSFGKHASSLSLRSLEDNESIDLDPRVFVNLWTARNDHIDAFLTAHKHSKLFPFHRGYKLWVSAVELTFRHLAPMSVTEQFKRLFFRKTNKTAVDHVVAGFEGKPGPMESLFRQHVQSVLEIDAFSCKCEASDTHHLWPLVEEHKWLAVALDYMVKKEENSGKTNYRLMEVLAGLRQEGQGNLRQIHLSITIDLVAKILEEGPWSYNPIPFYEHFVWAAKHASSEDYKRITGVISTYFQRESEALKAVEPEPDLKPTALETVKSLRMQIAQKVKRKAEKKMSKNAKKKNSSQISALREKLAKCFTVGKKVVIKDLVNATQLNGTVGTVMQKQNNQGRVGVKCNFDGKTKNIKLCNLDIAPEKPEPKSFKSHLNSMKTALHGFLRSRQGVVGGEELVSSTLKALKNIADGCNDDDRLLVFVEWVRDPHSICAGMVHSFLRDPGNRVKIKKRTYRVLESTYLDNSEGISGGSDSSDDDLPPLSGSSTNDDDESYESDEDDIDNDDGEYGKDSSTSAAAAATTPAATADSDSDLPDLVAVSSSDSSSDADTSDDSSSSY